jgi:hypothetical protein
MGQLYVVTEYNIKHLTGYNIMDTRGKRNSWRFEEIYQPFFDTVSITKMYRFR